MSLKIFTIRVLRHTTRDVCVDVMCRKTMKNEELYVRAENRSLYQVTLKVIRLVFDLIFSLNDYKKHKIVSYIFRLEKRLI